MTSRCTFPLPSMVLISKMAARICCNWTSFFKYDISNIVGPHQTASSQGFTSSSQGKNMLVIGTTSEARFLESVGLRDAYSVTYHLPTLKIEDAKKVLGQLNVFSEDDIDSAAEAMNDSSPEDSSFQNVSQADSASNVGNREMTGHQGFEDAPPLGTYLPGPHASFLSYDLDASNFRN